MSNLSPKELVPIFFDSTASSYDRVVNFATFGQDNLWKNEILSKVRGNSILDLACGTGILTRLIAQKFPQSSIVGVDITENYLKVARQNSRQLQNVLFVHQDAEKLELNQKFDCIVSSYIPKYCDAQALIKSCIKHLSPHGIIILHDFSYPKNSLIQMLWERYFHLLQFVGHFIPRWKAAFFELPKLIRSSKWIDDYTLEMKKEGFDVALKHHTFGCSCIITAQPLVQKR